MLGMDERRYKLWWSGNLDGVEVMVKDKLREKVVEVCSCVDSYVAL